MLNSTREFEACVHVRGKPVTEVVWEGRTYIEGRKRSVYELAFRNNTHSQVCVVPSVDGLSVVDGEPAGKESSGYIVDPFQQVVIPGWTVDGETAAEFIFHAQGAYRSDEQTYVEAVGEDPDNQGVIGFMVFRGAAVRRVKPLRAKSSMRRPIVHSAMPDPLGRDLDQTLIGGYVEQSFTADNHTFGVASSSVTGSVNYADSQGNVPSHQVDMDVDKSLGTGFGDAVDFETRKVEFHREADPCALFAFYYDTKKNLQRMGVPVEQFNRHYSQSYDNGPSPFPNSPEVTGYAKPPKGWTRRKTRR